MSFWVFYVMEIKELMAVSGPWLPLAKSVSDFFSRSGFDEASLMGTKYFAGFYQLNPICFLAGSEIRLCCGGSLPSGDQ